MIKNIKRIITIICMIIISFGSTNLSQVYAADYTLSNSSTVLTIAEGVTELSLDKISATAKDKITTINIPKSVIYIDENLSDCLSLKAVNVNASNKEYFSIDGVLYAKNAKYVASDDPTARVTQLVCYPQGRQNTEYILPEEARSVSVKSGILYNKYLQKFGMRDRGFDTGYMSLGFYFKSTMNNVNKNIIIYGTDETPNICSGAKDVAEFLGSTHRPMSQFDKDPVIIIPKKMTGLKQSSNTTTSIKLSWTKQSNITGYKLYKSTSKNGTYTLVSTIKGSSTTSYTNTKLFSGKIYYYKIRGYNLQNNKNYYGDYSSIITTSTKCATPSISLITPKSKTVKISWKKISGSSGYEVYRATSKSGKYSKIKTVTSGSTLSYTNGSLSSKKTYYYKVRAYKTVDGKKVYSSYSSIKYIKTK